jgi:hypothetical protein
MFSKLVSTKQITRPKVIPPPPREKGKEQKIREKEREKRN